MPTPRGAILESTRMVVSRDKERDEQTGKETVRTLTVSGAAILVTLKAGKDNRHEFWKYIRRHGMAARVVETTLSCGAYNAHGKLRQTAAEVPHVVQVLGSGDAFLRLPFQEFVADWDHILNVHAPRGGTAGWDGHSRTPPDASPRVRRECRMRLMPQSAQNEADRREMRDAYDVQRDTMAEFAELPATDARRYPQ